jgi:hypothetical protein
MPDSIPSCVLVPLLGRSGRSQFIGTSCCFGGIPLVRYCKHFIILEPPVSTPWRLSPNRGPVIATEQCGEADICVCNFQLFAVFSTRSLTCCCPLRLIWTAELLTARSSFAAPRSLVDATYFRVGGVAETGLTQTRWVSAANITDAHVLPISPLTHKTTKIPKPFGL